MSNSINPGTPSPNLKVKSPQQELEQKLRDVEKSDPTIVAAKNQLKTDTATFNNALAANSTASTDHAAQKDAWIAYEKALTPEQKEAQEDHQKVALTSDQQSLFNAAKAADKKFQADVKGDPTLASDQKAVKQDGKALSSAEKANPEVVSLKQQLAGLRDSDDHVVIDPPVILPVPPPTIQHDSNSTPSNAGGFVTDPIVYVPYPPIKQTPLPDPLPPQKPSGGGGDVKDPLVYVPDPPIKQAPIPEPLPPQKPSNGGGDAFPPHVYIPQGS